MITGIIARGFALTTALRAFVERRLGAALRRHAVAAHRVSARLADVNGPRGGIDKSCVIEVRAATPFTRTQFSKLPARVATFSPSASMV